METTAADATAATDAAQLLPAADAGGADSRPGDAPDPGREPPSAAPASPPPIQPTVIPPPPREHPFEFRGEEREYFRIWIVNLALTILTLGIYSAWAKVRTERYFYANTRVAGTPFEYTARPLPILRGRLIAFTLFGSYVLASRFSLELQLALVAVILLASPWLIVRGLMFRARYSSWRGLAFRFVPAYGAAYRWFLLIYLLFPLTLGFIFPYIKFRQKKFVVEQHRFGAIPFGFRAEANQFYIVYFIALGILIGAWIGLSTAMGVAFSSIAAHGMPSRAWIYGITAAMYAIYFTLFVYLAARIVNLTYNNAALDGFGFRSSVRARSLMRLYVFNTLGIVLSLGMLVPWAMIRMARYRASQLVLLAVGDLDALEAEAQGEVSAIGAEMDQVFDLDIGL